MSFIPLMLNLFWGVVDLFSPDFHNELKIQHNYYYVALFS